MTKIPPPPPRPRITKPSSFAAARSRQAMKAKPKTPHTDPVVELDVDDRPDPRELDLVSNYVGTVNADGPGLGELVARKLTTREGSTEYVGCTVTSDTNNLQYRWTEGSKEYRDTKSTHTLKEES